MTYRLMEIVPCILYPREDRCPLSIYKARCGTCQGDHTRLVDTPRTVQDPIERAEVLAEIDRVINWCEITAANFQPGDPMRYGRNGGVEALLKLRAALEAKENPT